jgi:hypothetical protein
MSFNFINTHKPRKLRPTKVFTGGQTEALEPFGSNLETMKKKETVSKSIKTQLQLAKSISPSRLSNPDLTKPCIKNHTSSKDCLETKTPSKVLSVSSKNSEKLENFVKINSKNIQNLSPLNTSNETLLPKTVNKTSTSVFKNFNLREELDLNENLVLQKIKCKVSTAADNMNSLSSYKNNDFEQTLKFCTGIVKDCIIRMNNIGRSGEGVLIDKLWRFTLNVLDDFIDGFNEKKYVPGLSYSMVDKNNEISCYKKLKNRINYSEANLQKYEYSNSIQKVEINQNKSNKIVSRIENIKKSIEILVSTYSCSTAIITNDPIHTNNPAKVTEKESKTKKTEKLKKFIGKYKQS